MSGERLTEVLLIGRDHSGTPRVIDLSGVTIELTTSSETERRLQEARKALEHYAEGDAGQIAREALSRTEG